MPTLELATPQARVALAPGIGGAITGFTVRGMPVLRPTPGDALATGDVRRTSCYPLVPYSNRIRDARLTFAGRDYRLARNFGMSPHAIHGVGWQRPWRVAEVANDHAHLDLVHDARGEHAFAWPWPFDAALAFHLADRGAFAVLRATLTIRNIGDAPFPFGLGFHPFFPKRPATILGLHADAVWLNDGTQLPQERIAIPREWRFDPPRALDDLVVDNVFTGFTCRATLDDDCLTRCIDADHALAFAVVYAPAGGDFVAVEPVSHETDAFDRVAAGATGTGARILRPGDAFSCTMRVAARALDPAAR